MSLCYIPKLLITPKTPKQLHNMTWHKQNTFQTYSLWHWRLAKDRLSIVFSLLIQGLSSPIISRSCDAAPYGTTVMHIKIDCHLQSPAAVSVNVHFRRMGQWSNWHAAAFAHWILNWDLQVTHYLRTLSHMSISYSLSSPHSHTAHFE